MLDLIGWSTAPDDLPVFGERLDRLFDLVVSAPWWIPWGFAFVSTLVLMRLSWPKSYPVLLQDSKPQLLASDIAAPLEKKKETDYLALPAPNAEVESARDLKSCLYVGMVTVDANKLKTENILEIAVLGFNGFDKPVSILDTSGSIEYSEIFSESQGDKGRLPFPKILRDRTNTKSIPPLSEIFFVLEQRIPKANVPMFIKAINQKMVQLRLDQLDISVGDETTNARLPIWAGVTLSKPTRNRVISNRLHVARVMEMVPASSKS